MRQYAQECLDAHNEYRAMHGSPPLVLSDWVTKQNNYFFFVTNN